MAYDYSISNISNISDGRLRRVKLPPWVDCYRDNEFKAVKNSGEIDYYGLFTKTELLEKATKYSELLEKIGQTDVDHDNALDYINSLDEAAFIISAIYWESSSYSKHFSYSNYLGVS